MDTRRIMVDSVRVKMYCKCMACKGAKRIQVWHEGEFTVITKEEYEALARQHKCRKRMFNRQAKHFAKLLGLQLAK